MIRIAWQTNISLPSNLFLITITDLPVFAQADFTLRHAQGTAYDGDSHRVKSVMQTNVAASAAYFVGNYYEVTGTEVTKYYYAGSQRIAIPKDIGTMCGRTAH